MELIKYGRKKSGIKRELKKKIDDWLASITDEEVRKIAEKNVIVTGGSIASMLLGEKINDYDVYFKTKKAAKKVAEYYVDVFNNRYNIKKSELVIPYQPYVKEEVLKNCKGIEENRILIYIKSAGVADADQSEYKYFEHYSENAVSKFAESLLKQAKKKSKKGKYLPTFLSDNAITLTNKLQIIIRFYGQPDEIHDNYDFEHAKCYWDHSEEELVLPPESLECLLSRTLIYRGSLYPIASIFRMKKFIERGWRITAGQQLKIMFQISELNLSDPELLREQLIGVDMAYMHQLLEALSGVDTDKINSSYIAEIIDRIFE